ncbi:MAG: GntR family transcriptional regulator [Bacillota bacterium]|nr:GntR family transcriptional regulator [Bacillota bacterium]
MPVVARPIFLQVKDEIVAMIEAAHQPGDRLPSEQELATRLGVSRSTVREALRVLENQGIIARKHGVGSFVRRRAGMIQSGIEELSSITDLIRQLGMQPGTTSLVVRSERADARLAERLGLGDDLDIVTFDRIRTADGQPVVYGRDRVPARLVPRLLSPEEFLTRYAGSLFRMLAAQRIQVELVRADIRPVGADRALSRKLGLTEGQPLLLLEQVHYSEDGDAVAFGEDYFHPDFFHFSVIRRAMRTEGGIRTS